MRIKLYICLPCLYLFQVVICPCYIWETLASKSYSVARKTTQTGQIHVYRTVSFNNASYERHTKTHEWECDLSTHIDGIGRIETSIEQTRTDPESVWIPQKYNSGTTCMEGHSEANRIQSIYPFRKIVTSSDYSICIILLM